MISFICPGCSGRFDVPDDMAGKVVTCGTCSATTMVPVDLACDGKASEPNAETITLAEMEALRKGLPIKPRP